MKCNLLCHRLLSSWPVCDSEGGVTSGCALLVLFQSLLQDFQGDCCKALMGHKGHAGCLGTAFLR